MAEIEIGRGKSGHRGVALADLRIVPTRRTRDQDDVDLSWKIDAYKLGLPLLGAGLDATVDVDDAVAIGEQGALPVIDLEALWAANPDQAELTAHVAKIKSADVRVAASVGVGRAEELAGAAIEAEVDVLVIRQGVISAEAVSASGPVLNLKTFIRTLDIPVIVGGCGSFSAARHLMRTGAAGVIVGVERPDLGVGAPLASAIGDAREARLRHLDETGVYCHLIALGGIKSGAEVAKALACGADAVMVDAALLRGADETSVVAQLREAMAVCGYTDPKSFQNAEVVVR